METLNQLVTSLSQIRDAIKAQLLSKRNDIKQLGTIYEDYHDNYMSPLTDALEDYPKLISELTNDLEVEFRMIGFKAMPSCLKKSIQKSIELAQSNYSWTTRIDAQHSDYAAIMFPPKLSWYETNNTRFRWVNEDKEEGMPYLIYLPTIELDSSDISQKFNGCAKLIAIKELVPNVPITNMSGTFYQCSRLTDPGIDFSQFTGVTNMVNCFMQCEDLQQLPVSNFDTSNIIDLTQAFYNCYSLSDLDTSNWDLSNLTGTPQNVGGQLVVTQGGLKNTFANCRSLRVLDTSNWNVPPQVNYTGTFSGCYVLEELDLTGFNLDGTANSYGTFLQDCRALTTIGTQIPVTSSCTDINRIFCNCYAISGMDTSNWDTQNVTNAESAFEAMGPNNTLSTSTMVFNKLERFGSMFRLCKALTQLDVSNWNMDNSYVEGGVTKHYSTVRFCQGCENLQSVTGFYDIPAIDPNTGQANSNARDYSSIKDMAQWFQNCFNLETVGMHNMTLTSLQTIAQGFEQCRKLTRADFSTWTVPALTNAGSLFANCYDVNNNTGIEYVNISGWNFVESDSDAPNLQNLCAGDKKLTTFIMDNVTVSNAKSIARLCGGCTALVTFSAQDASITFSNKSKYTTSAQEMFSGCQSLQSVDLSFIDFTNCGNTGSMFRECKSLASVKANFNMTKDFSLSYMFLNCDAIEDFNVDINFTNCTNMDRFLSMTGEPYARGMANATVDTSNWNLTSKLTNMEQAFRNCFALRRFEPLQFNASNITIFRNTFDGCKNLEYFPSDVVFGKLADCSYMFNACAELTELDLSGFKCNSAQYLCNKCPELQTVYLSKIVDGQRRTVQLQGNCQYMFYRCPQLNLVGLEYVDTSKVTSFYNIFPTNLVIDLGLLDPSSCTSLSQCGLPINQDVNLDGWANKLGNCTGISQVFVSDSSVNPGVYYNISAKGWRFKSGCNVSQIFRNTRVGTLDIRGWDGTGVDTSSALNSYTNVYNDLLIDKGFFNGTTDQYYFTQIHNMSVANLQTLLEALLYRSTHEDVGKTRTLQLGGQLRSIISQNNELDSLKSQINSIGVWTVN